MAETKYMTVKDYADKIGKTEKTIYNWIDSGKIAKENIKKVLNTTLVRI
jgi:predicted DNA-binding transcriptional regulator AlpA